MGYLGLRERERESNRRIEKVTGFIHILLQCLRDYLMKNEVGGTWQYEKCVQNCIQATKVEAPLGRLGIDGSLILNEY